ncbi:MAG: terminase, partial [Chloroflexi bacterium]|nr:terminase [Chloroflexota bacterium]
TPLPWQIEPWRDKSPTLLLTGSAGGGKSKLAGEKVHGFCLRYPNSTALVLRKAYAYAAKSVVPFLRQTVIGDHSQVTYRAGNRTFLYDNGSIIYAGGMRDEDQREAIRSIGGEGRLDIVWLEEANAFTETDYNEVLARMRGVAAPWTQVILTTNPDAPTHWIKRRLIDGKGAATYYSSAKDNPHNPASYAERLGELTGILKDRLVLGLWKQAEGAVYDQFDSQIHVVEPFLIPDDWRKLRAVDFGYTNPFTCQWWAVDGDGRMYLYREIYYTKRLVEDHARQIVDLSRGEAIETTVCDHDAEDRATLEKYGVPTVAAWKSVGPGIQAVQSRLRKAGDGKPRLFVFRAALVEVDRRLEAARRPTCTEQEFPAYVWYQAREGSVVKERPVKVNDHGMDGGRYAVCYVDEIGEKQKREVRSMR